MNTIKVKCSLGHIEYTPEQLENEINDFETLKECFLVLLNPEIAIKSDLYYDKKEALEYSKDIFINRSSYSNDFINKIFKNK